LAERDRTLHSLATTLLSAGFVVIVIASGIGWILSGITLRPIHRITQTAQKIGEERDFTQRVDYTGPPDEVGQLANTFNSMLGRLQEAYKKVEHSLQMQRDFVADVSHELRTPLTTLRGNLGLLRHAPPPEEQTDILNDMVDESDRLIRLVNDLLQLARADAGRNLAKETVNVSTILDESCRQAHLLDPTRSIDLDAAGNLNVAGDRDAIKQVILIALDNAIKHSAGNVELTAKRNGSQVEIKVQDFGEGIAIDKLEHVFDRFYRGNDSTMLPGFGLGLSIAKSLMDAMNGSISLSSAPNEGTIVRIVFPAAMDS
jgi:two-component system, OmpR family, sensor kinase